MKAKPTPEDIALTHKMISTNHIHLVIHAIYVINFCARPSTSSGIKYAHENVLYDMRMAQQIGAKAVVIHTGFGLKMEKETAISNMISNIVYLLKHSLDFGGVQLLLETSAGSGTQIGYQLDEFAQIYNGVKHSEDLTPADKRRFGMCLDTAHIFVAGYDIRTLAGWKSYLEDFDRLIGMEQLRLIHLNDSRWTLGKRHDEHRGIRHGTIFGEEHPEALQILRNIKKLAIHHNIPIVLETHGAGDEHDISPYEREIKLMKSL